MEEDDVSTSHLDVVENQPKLLFIGAARTSPWRVSDVNEAKSVQKNFNLSKKIEWTGLAVHKPLAVGILNSQFSNALIT